jgi:hypothetical protein
MEGAVVSAIVYKGAPRVLFLVERGPRPEYHKAQFHPVVICTARHTASWEAGWSGDRANLWVQCEGPGRDSSGWLLLRWKGLEIDYGHIVRSFTLPDGSDKAAISHDRHGPPWSLMNGAVWWSTRVIPQWLLDRGVVLPTDGFSVERIIEDAGACTLPESRQRRMGLMD